MNTWMASKPSDKIAEAIAKMNAATDMVTRSVCEYAGDDEHFALWLNLANARVMRITSMTINDLPDYLWRDAYDEGMSPREAASDMLLATEDF